MKRTYRYRLEGNNKIFSKAGEWLNLCCALYNVALEQRNSYYRRKSKRITAYEQKNQLPELRDAFPEYRDVGSQVLQDVIERLDKAYENTFRGIKKGGMWVGFPRFKGQNRYDSFTLKQAGWRLEGKYLIISRIGKFKIRLSRPIQGNIKTVTIHRSTTNKWHVCFNCDNIHSKILPQNNKVVGLDVGVKSIVVDSDGVEVGNHRFLYQMEDSLKRKQRAYSRKLIGSSRKYKHKVIVAKVYEKIRYQRNDFLHKLANKYIKGYGTIVFEDLNIRGMVRNHNLSKAIRDSCWGRFYVYCVYKAEEAGRQIIRIPRFEPTSKTCSNCGAVNQGLKINDRQWICQSCGVLHDRDYNAAKNIKRVGQTQQALTCAGTQSVACESLLDSKESVNNSYAIFL